MEKERRIKTLSLVALIVAVLGLTIAFAALSQTLTINGTASVDAASWDIHFNDIPQPEITGDAKVIKTPVLSDDKTEISDLEVSLTKPGDSVYYEVGFTNSGTISAEESDVLFLVNGFDVNNASETDVIKSIFIEADWNGDGITTDEEKIKAFENVRFEGSSNLTIEGGDADLIPGETGYFKFGFYYDSEATELPKGNVTLSLNTKINLVQK